MTAEVQRLSAAISAFKLAVDNTPQTMELEQRVEMALGALPDIVVVELDKWAKRFVELTFDRLGK